MAENNTNAPLIETSAVGFTYQGSETLALQDVTLSIGAGECVLLCGKSGCGKTTFTRLLNGLAPALFRVVSDLFWGLSGAKPSPAFWLTLFGLPTKKLCHARKAELRELCEKCLR